MTAIATGHPVSGDDIARAQGTDFFAMDDLLTEEERAIRDRVRAFVDDHLIPVANDYWQREEFAAELIPAMRSWGWRAEPFTTTTARG